MHRLRLFGVFSIEKTIGWTSPEHPEVMTNFDDKKRTNIPRSVLLVIVLLLQPCLQLNAEFKSSSTVEQVREQIERLPKEDIWWSVTGNDMSWNNRNLHRFSATVNVYRDGQVRELTYALLPEISSFKVDTPVGEMPFVDFLDSDYSTSLGVVILHRGNIVFEHYARMQPYEKPIWWSVSKVLVSAVVSVLEDRGLVDVSQPIETYIPEMATSSYAGTTVQNILNMTSGIDCPEEYYDRSSCYSGVMQAMGETWWDKDSPDNFYTYLAGIQAKRYAEQGTINAYGSVNTDILGWMVEKITGMPFQDALSKEIWTRIGAESDASYVAPRYGVPHYDGGFLSRMRDMARFGLLYTPSYTVVSDQRIISKRHINVLLNDGSAEPLKKAWGENWAKWGKGRIKHSSWQWDRVFTNNDIFKGGWAGQGLLVSPERDLVAVYTGYFKDDEYSELAVLPRLQAVLDGVFPTAVEGTP